MQARPFGIGQPRGNEPRHQLAVQRRPVFLAAPSATVQRSFLNFGRLGLPLAADGRTVDMILALVRPLP